MTPNDAHRASATELAGAVQKGDCNAVAVTEQMLARVQKHNPALGAYLYVDAEGALADAARLDKLSADEKKALPLAGVPVALKDNLCTRGVPTTCASKMLEGWVSPYDAHVVTRLREAGAVVLGKANMDEFAMGSSNENSAFGPVHNPWDLERAPGGSSGGSAASVAAGLATLALGSDTGGSVRQPASFTGLVALKPTYGRVSRYGVIAFASSLDQVGPFARNVRDCALISETISGHDRRDATCSELAVPSYTNAVAKGQKEGIRGMRIGIVRAELEQCESGVKDAVLAALKAFADLGAQIVDVRLDAAEHAVSAYYIVAPAECSSNLARFDGMRFGNRITGKDLTETYGLTRAQGFGPEVKRRIMLGTYVLSAGYYDSYYAKAQKARTVLRNEYNHALSQCDAVLTPTSPSVAFKLGAKTKNPLEMYLADIFTLPASLAGLPALSLPCGFSENLPIGMQLTGRLFDEETLFRLAAAYEKNTSWSDKHPTIFDA